jgi:Fe-S cluster assembly protein SufD
MSLQAGKETIYSERFKKSIENADQPEWLKNLRRKAFDYFTDKGFPTTRDEEWKYTSVSSEQLAVNRSEPSPVAAGLSPQISEILAEVESNNRLVFVDGVFNSDLSKTADLPEGVRIQSLADSFEDETFKTNFSQFVEYDFNGFTALNTAFTEQGLFIHIPKNTKLGSPVHIIFIGEKETANFPRILYVGETGSEAEFIEHYTRTNEAKYFTNAVVEINLADNARLVHTRVQRESHEAVHIISSQASLNRTSVYDNTNITLGAKISRHDVNMSFNAEGGEGWVDGLYLVEDGQHTDTHSRIDHRVKNCYSHQNYKGILDGKSRAVFNGKVFVHENASGTDAEQSNKNLLLSNEARVDTKPQLEIFNDDVKCAHGATVGQLEEEELFYLLSRGLNEKLARNLLTYGFAEEVINKIEISSIKKQLDEAVLHRLHARLEA